MINSGTLEVDAIETPDYEDLFPVIGAWLNEMQIDSQSLINWNNLLSSADEGVAHGLWISAARCIAETQIARLAERTTDIDEGVEELVSEWFFDSSPVDSEIIRTLGELPLYWTTCDSQWDEVVSFSGRACFNPSDVIFDLKRYAESHPYADDVITYENVEECFSEWRERFQERLIKEVEKMSSEWKSEGDSVDSQV